MTVLNVRKQTEEQMVTNQSKPHRSDLLVTMDSVFGHYHGFYSVIFYLFTFSPK